MSNEMRPDFDFFRDNAPFGSKEEFLGMLTYVQIKRGYQPGWISHMFNRLYQEWPEEWRDLDPLEPPLEFYHWVNALNRLGADK